MNLTQKSQGSDYVPTETQDSLESYEATQTKEDHKKMREQTLKLMMEHSQLFMGVQPEWIDVIDLLAAELPVEDAKFKVMLVLRRIRLNEVYCLLSLYLGISISTLSETFRLCLGTVSACMKELLHDPGKAANLRNLPVGYRMNFDKVTHILDAFEVEIQRPSNAKHRAITWSSYKHGPTLKYLISITPDCFCNYVSRGYGGRNSDIGMVKDCGLLEEFRHGNSVLADRGFKSLEALLEPQGVDLQRPPSTYAGKALSLDDCVKGRQIASVRIHVERYIGRLRQFQIIKPHAVVCTKMVPLVDHCVIIACGLTNLGVPLIKANEFL